MWATKGQQRTVDSLRDAITRGQESHAYLIEGPEGAGKSRLALDMFKALNCTTSKGDPCDACEPCGRAERCVHPDLTVIQREEKATRVQIAQVREATERLYVTATMGGYGCVLIDNAELMTEDAANALLKSLEEPPELSVLMLLSEQRGGTLATIESRCQVITMMPASREEIERDIAGLAGMDRETAHEIAGWSDGWFGRARRLAEKPEERERLEENQRRVTEAATGGLIRRFAAATEMDEIIREDRAQAGQILAGWAGWWRDRMVEAAGAPEYARRSGTGTAINPDDAAAAITESEQATRAIEQNANARTTIERMMLRTPPASTENERWT